MQHSSHQEMYARLVYLLRATKHKPTSIHEREIERLCDYLQNHNPYLYSKALYDFNVADIIAEDEILIEIQRIDFMSHQEIKSIIHKLKPSHKADINQAIGLTNTDEFEFFKVTGKSMIEADIMPGDQVVIQKTARPKNGDMVIAVVKGKTLLKQYSTNDDGVLLESYAKNIPPMALEFGEAEIRGVVIGIVRGK